jgi:hypothetical protein
LRNAKQVVLIGSADARKKGGDGYSFLAHEIKVIQEFNLPIVIANKDGNRLVDINFIPEPLLNANYYTVSVSFQPAIIKYALDNYASTYSSSTNKDTYYYKDEIYARLGI